MIQTYNIQHDLVDLNPIWDRFKEMQYQINQLFEVQGHHDINYIRLSSSIQRQEALNILHDHDYPEDQKLTKYTHDQIECACNHRYWKDNWAYKPIKKFVNWDNITTHSVNTLDHRIIKASCSPDSKYLLLALKNFHLQIWDLQNRNQIGHDLIGHQQEILSLEYSSNLIISSSKDKTIRIWNPQTQTQIGISILMQDNQQAIAACISPNGQHIVSLTEVSQEVIIWNIQNFYQSFQQHVIMKAQIINIQFSRNKRQLLLFSSLWIIYVYDPRTFNYIGSTFQKPSGWGLDQYHCIQNHRSVYLYKNGNIRRLNINTMKIINDIRCTDHYPGHICLSADSKLLVLSHPKKVIVFNLLNERSTILKGQSGVLLNAQFLILFSSNTFRILQMQIYIFNNPGHKVTIVNIKENLYILFKQLKYQLH